MSIVKNSVGCLEWRKDTPRPAWCKPEMLLWHTWPCGIFLPSMSQQGWSWAKETVPRVTAVRGAPGCGHLWGAQVPCPSCRPHALGQAGVLVTVSRLLSKEVAVLSGLPGNRVSKAEGRPHTRRGDDSQRPQCSCGEILLCTLLPLRLSLTANS